MRVFVIQCSQYDVNFASESQYAVDDFYSSIPLGEKKEEGKMCMTNIQPRTRDPQARCERANHPLFISIRGVI